MEPFEEKVSVIKEDCVWKTQLSMANHHFPGFQITGMCDNLLLITFFSSFQKLHRSFGNIKDFQRLWQKQYSSRIHCSGKPPNLSTIDEKCLNPATRLESLSSRVRHSTRPPTAVPSFLGSWLLWAMKLYDKPTHPTNSIPPKAVILEGQTLIPNTKLPPKLVL